jgi:nicotinamide-nucleotide amidase
MRCEIIAVGTELLLGQTIDSNSAWIAEQLALAGLDAHFQTRVGDNMERMVSSIRLALERNEAVIMCGGLGPTQDDITRFALAEVMGSALRRDPALVARIGERFRSRGREMPGNNLLQADVPDGATPIAEMPGTAPGLICPVGDGVVYAVPGVPSEMKQMISGTVLRDLKLRAGVAAVIKSRTLRTWGYAESKLAELLTARIEALDATGNPTLAFLASGIEGIKVRITAKAASETEVGKLLSEEERRVRAILGDTVFGVDEQTMESVVINLLRQASLSLATAESLTGGLLGARITDIPGASDVFRGGLVAYANELKQQMLGVPPGPVVSETTAIHMAAGVRRLLNADVGLATTGVAGPSEQEGQAVGTVYVALAIGEQVEARRLQLGGNRKQIRQFAVIGILNMLRRRLLTIDDQPRAAP